MNQDEIQRLIPHRPPMLLIDRVVSRDGDRIECERQYRPEEHFLQGHYPGFPIVPGVILCETALQAGAILLALRGIDNGGVPVVTRMDNIRLKRTVRPGETVRIHCEITDSVSSAWYLTGRLSIGSQTVARLDFACTMVPREQIAPVG